MHNTIEQSLILQSISQSVNFEEDNIYSSNKNPAIMVDLKSDRPVPAELEIHAQLVQYSDDCPQKLPYDIVYFKKQKLNEHTLKGFESKTIKQIIPIKKKEDLAPQSIKLGHFKDNQFVQLALPDQDQISIGRHQNNSIILENQQISNVHAIIKKDDGFELFDNQSQNSTYLKIQQTQDLVNNSLVEIGNSLIKISYLSYNNFYKILIEKKEGTFMKNTNKTSLCFQLNKNQMIQFGRKTQKNIQQQFNNNDVNYILIEDNILSSKHCQIVYSQDGMLKLVDNNSSNGTWLKLQQPITLQTGDIFRLSNIEKGEQFKVLQII